MPLTDVQIKKAKTEKRQEKFYDTDDLYLLVEKMKKESIFGKYWRFKCRFAGSEVLLSLGVYPDLPL